MGILSGGWTNAYDLDVVDEIAVIFGCEDGKSLVWRWLRIQYHTSLRASHHPLFFTMFCDFHPIL